MGDLTIRAFCDNGHITRQGSSACCCILTRRASEGNAPDSSLRFGLVYDLLCCRGNTSPPTTSAVGQQSHP